MSFRIVVDSCCDLTPSMLRSPALVSVPLTIHLDGETIVDDAGFDQANLLWRMKASEKAPQTSCPSPADYLDAFESADGDIYVVTLSALLSGSHNAARQATRLFLEEHPQRNIHVFNSCSASAG